VQLPFSGSVTFHAEDVEIPNVRLHPPAATERACWGCVSAAWNEYINPGAEPGLRRNEINIEESERN